MLKKIIRSRTIWGALIALVSAISTVAGLPVSLEVVLTQSGVIVGAVLSIYGRIDAKGPIV